MEAYAIYLRKSRMDIEAEERGEGDTLSRHEAALLKLAGVRGLCVAEVYREIRSGETIAARPEMRRLLKDVEAGRYAGVLVMEIERLARGNTTDQGMVADTFQYSHTKIVTPSKDYDPDNEFDEEYFEFGLFMSRREYKAINRRLQRGRLASLSEGKYIAGRAAYGYERYKLPKEKGYSLRIVPEQAEVVRRIFNWYVNGERMPDGSWRSMGSFTIAKRLDAQGIPSPSGGKWPPCTVKEILKNPAYLGKIRWSYRPSVRHVRDGKIKMTRPEQEVPLFRGLHEPILPEGLWNRAQEILKERSHAPVPQRACIRNPLAGLVVCSKCGRSMERRKFQHGREVLMCPNKDCDMKSSVLESVEDALLYALRCWLGDYQVELKYENTGATGASAAAERELAQLRQTARTTQSQLNRLCDLVEQGVYSAELFAQRSRLLTEKIERIQGEISAAEGRLSTSLLLERGGRERLPRLERVLEVYPSLASPEEKNHILREILDKVLYSCTKGGRWVESDLKLFLFPKLSRHASSSASSLDSKMCNPIHRSSAELR